VCYSEFQTWKGQSGIDREHAILDFQLAEVEQIVAGMFGRGLGRRSKILRLEGDVQFMCVFR